VSWYSLGLAGGLENISKAAWQLAWEISQTECGPDDSSAIFKKIGPDHRLILYFTPSSQLVAETFGARRCSKPSPSGMSLVAGAEGAWLIHFGRLFNIRRRIGALRAWGRPAFLQPGNPKDWNKSPLNQHILELFKQAKATPQKGTSMLLALATWAEANLQELQIYGLQPTVDALRRAEQQDPASLSALLEEADQEIEQAQSLDEAAWVLLREVAGWMPTARAPLADCTAARPASP
jgi:hypothetical protein